MKYLVHLLFIFFISCSGPGETNSNLYVIPSPNQVTIKGGMLKTGGHFRLDDAGGEHDYLFKSFLSNLPFTEQSGHGDATYISVWTEPELVREAYRISIGKSGIEIFGGDHHGVFNAFQTLTQMILFAEGSGDKIGIPCCEISDSPRFGWRGIMLDESRHFFGEEKVKQLLDMMALHKLNVFHWHLTDEPGWRVEIEKYPRLTEIGGRGNYQTPDTPPMYYTQEQIRDVVQYAAERFIQVVPEIDMPGHASAANKAYPEFSGGGSKTHPEWTFNPGKEGAYQYLTDILTEVSGLFPAPYIHIGGDEVDFGNEQWNHLPEISALMKKQNLEDLREVERYFINRMSDSINALDRTTIGWDEIVDAGVPAGKAIAMWWRHDKLNTLYKTLEQDYRVILSPRNPLYFDFDQDSTHRWGRRGKGFLCDLEAVYDFPPDTIPELSRSGDQVLGIQANIWSERIQNGRRLDFMTYPRLQALAEAAWTFNAAKDYQEFIGRLQPVLDYMDDKGIYYYNPFDPGSTPEPEGVPKRNRW